MSSLLPDPVAYVADALAASGALVDPDGAEPFVVLPADLAAELGVGEECRLTARAPDVPRDDLLVCGVGSPALERLAARLDAAPVQAAARLDVPAPRLGQARALAERFAVRNAPVEPGEAAAVSAHYLVAWLAWTAEADDRYDGVVRAGICLGDLGDPDPGLLELADPLSELSRFVPAAPAAEGSALRRALAALVSRAERELEQPVAEVRTIVSRRLHRDHERIAEYFEALARDARAPRRKTEPAAVEARLAHLTAERDAKLRALGERYRLRVTISPLALIQVQVPALQVRVRVRRRKLDGELLLRLAPGANAFDALPCAACPSATSQPLVCDDRLHVLCETCAPSAQGRPACSACHAERR